MTDPASVMHVEERFQRESDELVNVVLVFIACDESSEIKRIVSNIQLYVRWCSEDRVFRGCADDDDDLLCSEPGLSQLTHENARVSRNVRINDNNRTMRCYRTHALDLNA